MYIYLNVLKELEEDGFIRRVQFNEIPPHVEYSFTEKGRDLMPIFTRLWCGDSSMKTIKQQILTYAKKVYKTVPDAPFRTAPTYLVLRHADTRKWYALFMDVPREKLGLSGDGYADILNVKCDPIMSGFLRMGRGILPAYHMNRDSWLTILLDGTVPAKDIFPLLDMSYELTREKRKRSGAALRNTNWIIPANPKYYDIEAAVNENAEHTFLWKQSNHIAVGDTVYLYIAAPVSAIRYQCKAIEVDIPYQYADENVSMSHVMRLQLFKAYDAKPIGRELLKAHGVNAVRGPRSMPDSLIHEIETMYHA